MAHRDPGLEKYWRRNKLLIAALLSVWALVSFGFGLLLARPLSSFSIGRLPAGFWWAQQGAMFVFVVLIFLYAKVMDRFDRDLEAERERSDDEEEPAP